MASAYSPPSLVALRNEADRRAPNRNRASDGWLGDFAHRRRKSGHNPKSAADPVVLARDITHDPPGGLDAHALADAIVARRDPRIDYVISRGRIASSKRVRLTPAWKWRRYRGANPHDKHIHVQTIDTPAARNDTSPWWLDDTPPEQEDDMALIDTRRGYVRALYLQLLGRHPESAEAQEHWANRIAAVGLDVVVRELADSDEARLRREGTIRSNSSLSG